MGSWVPGKASTGTGWGAKRGAEGTGFGMFFLLMSLSVEGKAKEKDLGLHSTSSDCSREGLQATSGCI